MNNLDFFFVFLLAIAISRLILAFPKRIKPAIGNFRVRHYMYAVILIPLGLYIDNIVIYAFGIGLLIDELPLILIRGLGYKDEHWKGCDDYFTAWCVAGVFIGICIVYLLKDYLIGFIY